MITQLVAMPAPEGYVVDYDNPMIHGNVAGYWVFGVGMVLSFSFLCMRTYTKLCVARNFAVEDACLIVAWLCGVTVQVLLVLMWLNRIIGVHAWEISIDKYNTYSKLIMSASVLYVPCLGLSKFSLLLFYNRLSPVRWFRAAVYILMFIVLGYSFAIIFALIFPCRPVNMNWDVTITHGKCINRGATYTATAAVNIATDLALLILPIPMIADLRMPRVQKVGLILIFIVGSLTFITSIIRLIIMMPLLVALDQTWAVSVPCVWITVEANLVIICGSFPIIRQFVKHVSPGCMGEGATDKTNPGYPYDLETIGQKSSKKNRPSHRAYGVESLADIDNDLELDGRDIEHKVEIEAGGRTPTGFRGGSGDSDTDRVGCDDGSETYIVQTNVTNVSFSKRN
ncbi:hypothetical protein DSL72_008251 [Monilinia vaccinii-corymbosi]|uniref:Rhodopsin domain-containing protein n=1 Tax=Monilinia vaccinii-corymbosi TaxID=61207 RepID=A0A8A3PKA6_9HELO|nr:hypothetical protein DSL72_008251 [Monilinia vaccinii-corymbosi]